MTAETKPLTVALVGGPLNGHDDDGVVLRALDQGVGTMSPPTEPPERITATPAGLFYDLNVPTGVGRYERWRGERKVDETVTVDATYVWTLPR
jgi:hypothetical protein